MNAGKDGIEAAPAAAARKAANPRSKSLAVGKAAIAASLVCFAICPPSFVCDSPVLGFACAATWPLGSPRDSLTLGYQATYTYQGRSCTHRGVDIAAAAGALVCAPCGGRVAFCGEVPASQADGGADDGATMTAVSIELEDGRRLTLMPFESTLVSAGEAVAEGQGLGALAASGDRSSRQAHLHMGLKQQGAYCNPLALFEELPLAAGSSEQAESSHLGAGGSTSQLPEPAAVPAQEPWPAQAAQALQAEPSFGAVSSGDPVYQAAAQEEARPWTAEAAAAAGALAAACCSQLNGLLGGLGELSSATGIPFFALVLASTALVVGLLAGIVLQLMHLRGERSFPLNGKASENALLCTRVGGDNMHKLFPAPGTSFITRGRSAQRR